MDDANSHWQNVLKRQATGQYFQTYLSLINTTNDHFESHLQNPTVLKIEPTINAALGHHDSPNLVNNTTSTILQNVVTSQHLHQQNLQHQQQQQQLTQQQQLNSPTKKRVKREGDRGPGRARKIKEEPQKPRDDEFYDWKCSYCTKGFKEKGHLRVHERIHTGEKPYSCAVCGKAFSQKGNLQTHMKRHNGTKEFKCKYCLKDYIQKSHLVNHIEKFHKKDYEDDDNIFGFN